MGTCHTLPIDQAKSKSNSDEVSITSAYSNIKNGRGITCNKHGDIIISCAEECGLHLLNSQGSYVFQIREGTFIDASCHLNKLFTLQKVPAVRKDKSEQSAYVITVLEFKAMLNQWVKVNEFELGDYGGYWWDRICVHKSGIFISSMYDHCIYKYSHKGKTTFLIILSLSKSN